MRATWFRRHGLLTVNILLFLVFLVGMTIAGWQVSNDDLVQHGLPPEGLVAFLGSGDFADQSIVKELSRRVRKEQRALANVNTPLFRPCFNPPDQAIVTLACEIDDRPRQDLAPMKVRAGCH